jgi:hypothetical protein
MRHAAASDGTHLRRQEGCFSNRFTCQGHEFDFVARACLMDVYNCANVTRLQFFAVANPQSTPAFVLL